MATIFLYAPTDDPERVITAWRPWWPEWRWAEFRDARAVALREALSGAHAAMLHGGNVICVRPGDHGDYEDIAQMIDHSPVV